MSLPFWSRQPYFCLNFQSEALIVSVCLCVLPGERLVESVPAAWGGMLLLGYLGRAFLATRGAWIYKEGAFVPHTPAGGETSWCGPRQKAVKEKVSVQTSATAALVCWFLVLQTLFKGLPLILVMKETWIPAGKSHRQGNTVMVCFAKCHSVLLFLHGPGGQTESWLYFIWSLPPSHVVSSSRKSLWFWSVTTCSPIVLYLRTGRSGIQWQLLLAKGHLHMSQMQAIVKA